jgi:hypothetical protein
VAHALEAQDPERVARLAEQAAAVEKNHSLTGVENCDKIKTSYIY